MSQQDVYDYLKSLPPKWLSTREIQQGMNKTGMGSVARCLKMLKYRKDVITKERPERRNEILWKIAN